MEVSKQKTGYILILTAGTLWGSVGFFVSTLGSLGVESSVTAFFRIAFGAVLLVPLMLFSGGKTLFRMDRRGLVTCLALGVFCQALFNFSYSEAIRSVGVATGSVLLYTAPVFVCIMSAVFFKEKIGIAKIAALAVNVGGCVLTVTGGDFSSVRFSAYGVAAGIGAGFLYGLMTIISSTATDRYHPLTILFYSFVFGAVVLAVIAGPDKIVGSADSKSVILAAVGYGLIPTVGAYFFYMKGLAKGIETSKVPVIASIETVVAAAIGILIFHESSGLFKLAGIGLVILSIALMNMPLGKRKSTMVIDDKQDGDKDHDC